MIVKCEVCEGTGYVSDDSEYGEYLDECPACRGECCVEVIYEEVLGEVLRVH